MVTSVTLSLTEHLLRARLCRSHWVCLPAAFHVSGEKGNSEEIGNRDSKVKVVI